MNVEYFLAKNGAGTAERGPPSGLSNGALAPKAWGARYVRSQPASLWPKHVKVRLIRR